MAGKSSGKAAERLALVDETQADRQTIEIYELVTRKMRVGRVPLLFKALAAEKALTACWQALRPAIRVEPTDHPLAVDQRNGITLDKAWDIVHRYKNRTC